MYLELNQQMEEAQQGIFRLHKIDSMLAELHKEQATLDTKASELKEILEKEELDVTKLENKGLASLFYSVLGTIEEKVEKERREVLAAKLKFGQAEQDLENINYEISKLSSERIKYKNSERTYKKLYDDKKELLMKSDSTSAEQLMELTERYQNAKNNRKEINEAISAGKNVLDSLSITQNSLNSAEGWGVWDMFGGGLISDLAKHSHIDSARSETERTQSLLRRFKTELTDIRISNDINIEISGFSKFADFFFDGLIADWFMQSKIHNSQENVNKVQSQVQSVMSKLNTMKNQETIKLENLEKEMDDMVTKA